jgi:hypothetical protein
MSGSREIVQSAISMSGDLPSMNLDILFATADTTFLDHPRISKVRIPSEVSRDPSGKVCVQDLRDSDSSPS